MFDRGKYDTLCAAQKSRQRQLNGKNKGPANRAFDEFLSLSVLTLVSSRVGLLAELRNLMRQA
jgi:hypothetical protein